MSDIKQTDQPTVAFATVGCRLNQAETDSIREHFAARGYEVVDFSESADVYYVNTCTVTGRADRSSRQLIHKARRKNPDALLVAAGCFATRDAEAISSEGEADIVLGSSEKSRPFDYLPTNGRPEKTLVYVSEEDATTSAAVGTRITGRSRAFLKVQDGCDHECAYCAVTLVRGKSRSAPLSEIKEALKRVKNAGFTEVILTGVDLTAWGREWDDFELDWIDLVELAADIGIPRVRVSSLEPWELSVERIRRLAAIDSWCEHFHISLQSADADLVAAMGRPTDMDELRAALQELLKLRPATTIGADVIAGLPGESDEAFTNTLDFLDSGPLHYLHVFPFSSRPGTVAAKMEDQIDSKVVVERAAILRSEGRQRKHIHMHRSIGKIYEVLIEETGNSGFTRSYLKTRIINGSFSPRSLQRVKILDYNSEEGCLIGELDCE